MRSVVLVALCLVPLSAWAEGHVYQCTRYKKTETVVTNLPNCGLPPKPGQKDPAAAGRTPAGSPAPEPMGASGSPPEGRPPPDPKAGGTLRRPEGRDFK